MTHARRARAGGCPEYVTVRLAFAGHEGHGPTGRSAKPGWPKNVCPARLIGPAAFLLADAVAWIMPVDRCLHLCVDVVDFGQGCGRRLSLRSGYDVLVGRVITCLVLVAAAQGRQRQGVAS